MPAKTLFSQHYLAVRLPQLPEWAEDPRPAYEALRALWQQAQQFGATWNEAQTEEMFIRPALQALGWAFIVQTPAQRGQARPDYALFADAAARDAAYPLQGQDEAFYGRALAIAEAKYWGRPLSQKDSAGRERWESAQNPSHQMVSYLVGTRVPWGILTNGQVWRLYSREVSSTASEFYEVDLAEVLGEVSGEQEAGSGEADSPSAMGYSSFKRFWLFFRRAAFTPDGQGRSFVQRVHEGSTTYAREISDKLKDLVFQEVMPELAGGFVAYRHRQLGVAQETEEDLRTIYQASLSLLYKLLFLLYAEARGLLPLDNPGYREQSLTELARWAADRLDRQLPLSDATFATPKYDALLALFRRVDQGDPGLGLPRYNGGLFNPANPDNRFLEQHRLSDRTVARVVDRLVRDAGEPVDYAYISVRNLGAIYEGLLENRLQVVDAAAGQVVLLNDRGERKATGSYYTPDYIVEYIVRQTLEPLLEERAARFTAAMARVAELRRRLARTADPGTTRVLREQLEPAERDAREAFLGLKVLDPAMGSGHFLVNAVDFLTDGIIRRLQLYHDTHPEVPWEWNPLQQLLERVRREILAELARQGLSVDPRRLDDTALLTRLVLKRCIYGVDLNPMAVELAKLSLWLHSFTLGAPLSFVDHHLRCGNSLIGTDVRTVEAAIQRTATGQFGLFAGPFAGLLDLTALMLEVVERADATLADVKQSAEQFDRLQRELTPHKQILDLWVSRHFGNAAADEFLRLFGETALPALRGEQVIGEKHRQAIARARELWREKRFFHWDLEFPEVFVDLQRRDWAENPGFDAVIGNPPWGSEFAIEDSKCLQLRFETAHASMVDSYVMFTELATLCINQGGRCGYIIPDTILRKDEHEHLRKFLLLNTVIEELVETGPVFRQARDTWCLIMVLIKQEFSAAHKICHKQIDRFVVSPEERLDLFKHQAWIRNSSMPQQYWLSRPKSIVGYLASEAEQSVIRSIERDSVRLEQHDLGLSVSRGEEGSKYALQYQSDSAFKIVTPELVERYWVGEGIPIGEDYLTINKINDYYTHPKVWVIRIQKLRWPQRIVASFDGRTNSAGTKTLQMIVSRSDNGQGLLYLVALLNSRLLNFWCTDYLVDDLNQSFLERVPIRRIDFTTPAEERARRLAEGQALAAAWVAAPGAATMPYGAFLTSPPGRWLAPAAGGVSFTQTDVCHDLLAALAADMLTLNREKQAEMRGFLRWLERTLGAPPAALTGKSRLLDYPGDYQKGEAELSLAELLALLRKNRRRLAVDPDARAFQELLEREYEASLARLLPLKARLAATDRLIDLLVYRLYGLTEAEVAIVEGARS